MEIKDNLSSTEYNELRNSVGWDSKDINVVEKSIKSSSITKKAVEDNKAIGMARAIGDGIYYLIVDVVVNPAYQRKGIGKALVNSIVKEIENNLEEGRKCSINLVSMKDKEEFYEKCGFKKIPFDYTGYGMIKRIEKNNT